MENVTRRTFVSAALAGFSLGAATIVTGCSSSQQQPPKTSPHTKTLTDENFGEIVLAAKQPVLVDFWAPWCGPCRRIAPTIEELADLNAGVAIVGKVNIDDNPGLAAKYNAHSIPTLLVFKNGKVLDRMVGVQTKSRLQEAIAAAK